MINNVKSGYKTVSDCKCKECGSVLLFYHYLSDEWLCPKCGKRYYEKYKPAFEHASKEEIKKMQTKIDKSLQEIEEENRSYAEWCKVNSKNLLRFLKEHGFLKNGDISETWNGF